MTTSPAGDFPPLFWPTATPSAPVWPNVTPFPNTLDPWPKPPMYTLSTGVAQTEPKDTRLEVVLARILQRLADGNFVVFLRDDEPTISPRVSFARNDEELTIRIPPALEFEEIVEQLYEELGVVHGRALE